MDLQEALKAVRTSSSRESFDEEQFHAACTYLVQNPGELPHRVFINLPGGLSGNDDSKWDEIKKLSEERCGCGNERVINPTNLRTEYVPGEQVRISGDRDNTTYIKPVGGDRASTYVGLWIENDAVAYMMEPFAPLVFTADIFSTPGFALRKLADALEGATDPLVLKHVNRKAGYEIPLFAFQEIDVAAQTATIRLDQASELLSIDELAGAHSCE